MESRPLLWTKDFIGISAIYVLLCFGWQMFLPTLPLYIHSLGGSDSIIGICTALGTAASLIIRPLSGLVLDRFGRKGVLFTGLVMMITVTLLYNLFPVLWAVIVIRFIHGLSLGIATTAGLTVASDIIPKSRVGEGLGFFMLTQSFAFMLAPAAGLALVASVDFKGMTLVAAGMLLLSFLSAFFIKYHGSMKKTAPVKFVLFERLSLNPSVAMVPVSAAFGAILIFISLYCDEKGMNGGLFFMVCAASVLVSRILLGKLIDRFGFNIVILPGYVLFTASMAMLYFVDSLPFLLLVAAAQGAGYGLVHTGLQTMAIISVPQNRLGAANATFFTAIDLGTGFGSIAAGILSSLFGLGRMFLIISAAPALSLAFYFFVIRRTTISRPLDEEGIYYRT